MQPHHQSQSLQQNCQLTWRDTMTQNQNTFSSMQMSTIHLINGLINAIDSKETQGYLQQFYDKTPALFMQTLLSIINKCLQTANNIAESNKQVYCVLLYFRHFINVQNHRMPDFIKQFTGLYPRINNKNSRDLLVDCIRVFLTKSHHKPYTKDYLHQISFNLLQQIQKNQVDEIYLKMIVQTLENLCQSKDYRPGLAIESESMIKTIISKYSTKKPLNIDTDLWVWTIITLCTYTKFVPSIQFICLTLNKQGYSAKMYGKLFAIVNKMHHLFGSVEQVYQILHGQLKRLLNRKFIGQLEQECGVQGLQTLVKSVVYLIKDSFSLINQSNTSDINQFMLFQYFKQYNLFQTSLLGILQIVKQHHHDYSQFFYLLTQLLEQFSQFLQENVMLNFASQIKHKVSGQYMYCLLSGLPRNCLQIFGASGLLLQNINYILQNKHTVNIMQRKTMGTMELFLQFILHYLDVNHFLENQSIGEAIYKFVNQFIALLPQNSANGKSHEQVLKIKSYGISLLISMQKFNPHPDNNSISRFLYMVYELMVKVISASGAQKSEIISICVEGLGYLKFIGAYKHTLSECIINFFTTQLGTESKYESNEQYIFVQLLKVLYDCYDIEVKQQNKELVCLIYILKWFIETHNKSMQDQASQFILRLLYATNSLFAKGAATEDYIKWCLSNVYETGVFAYIKQCFLKEDEDFLYCKILMETLIHKSGSKLVEDILTEVCSSPESHKISHNFDKVWQALVILYEVRNEYTQKRLINERIDNIMGGSLEALLMNMSLDEQNEYKRKSNKVGNKRIHWSWLPEVRKVLEAGSYVGFYVEYRLNNGVVEAQ